MWVELTYKGLLGAVGICRTYHSCKSDKKPSFNSPFSAQEINDTISCFFQPQKQIVTPPPPKQAPITPIEKLTSGKELFPRVSSVDSFLQNENPTRIRNVIESRMNAYKIMFFSTGPMDRGFLQVWCWLLILLFLHLNTTSLMQQMWNYHWL